MSKKKRHQLTGLLIALAAALVILLIVVLCNKYQAAREEAEAESSTVYTGLSEDPAALSWTTEDGTVSLIQNADGDWVWAEDADFPLNDSLVQSIVSALANPAQREMEAADTLEAYGLTEPAITVETTDSDGNTVRLLIGSSFTESDSTGSSTVYYYARTEGSETILQLDDTLVEQLGTLYELGTTSRLASLTESQVATLTIQGTETITLNVESETTEDEDGESTTSYLWYADGTDVTDSTVLSELKSELLKCSFTSMADWKPDAAALETYGLNNPIMVAIAYTDSDGNAVTQTLSIGALDESGSYYYCSPDGGQSIYLAGAAGLADTITVAGSGWAAAEAAAASETDE